MVARQVRPINDKDVQAGDSAGHSAGCLGWSPGSIQLRSPDGVEHWELNGRCP